MKKTFYKPSSTMMLAYITTIVMAFGSFGTSTACKTHLFVNKKLFIEKKEKQTYEAVVPMLNPLQIITPKFF